MKHLVTHLILTFFNAICDFFFIRLHMHTTQHFLCIIKWELIVGGSKMHYNAEILTLILRVHQVNGLFVTRQLRLCDHLLL